MEPRRRDRLPEEALAKAHPATRGCATLRLRLRGQSDGPVLLRRPGRRVPTREAGPAPGRLRGIPFALRGPLREDSCFDDADYAAERFVRAAVGGCGGGGGAAPD